MEEKNNKRERERDRERESERGRGKEKQAETEGNTENKTKMPFSSGKPGFDSKNKTKNTKIRKQTKKPSTPPQTKK